MVRAPFYDKNGLKKGAWSPEEDKKLKAYIERYGHWNWRELPKFAGLERCGKSCRLRWMNYLRPNVKRGNFSQDEEEIILKLHAELGNKWSIIAAKLPGRTDNEIKNHWHTTLKKRAMENQARIDGKYEVKEQHSGHFSDHKSGHSKDLKADNIRDDAFCHPILESSPLSPEASSSDMLSSLSHELVALSADTNRMRDGIVMQEMFEDFCGDFWTEPFIAESNAYLQNNTQFSFEAGDFDWTYASLYDNHEYLMYQVMQELPEN